MRTVVGTPESREQTEKIIKRGNSGNFGNYLLPCNNDPEMSAQSEREREY